MNWTKPTDKPPPDDSAVLMVYSCLDPRGRPKWLYALGCRKGKHWITENAFSEDLSEGIVGRPDYWARIRPPDEDFTEALIKTCLPGGSSCDPQQVADAIREYLR